MKKFAMIMSGLLFSAAIANAQVELAVEAGASLTQWSQNFDQPDDELPLTSSLRYRFGLKAMMPVGDNLSLNTGITYAAKGASFDLKELFGENSDLKGYNRLQVNYLELPVNLGYTYNGITFFGGGYFALGVAGKNTYDFEYSAFGVTVADEGSESIDFGSERDSNNNNLQVSSTDYGFNVGAGYQVGDLQFSLMYSKGLKNMNLPDPDNPSYDPDSQKVTNSTLSFSVAFFW